MKRVGFVCVVVCLSLPAVALPQIAPPAPGVELPQAYYDRRADDPTAFQFQKAWIEKARRAKAAREEMMRAVRAGDVAYAAMTFRQRQQTVVTGTIRVPVLCAEFSNRSQPYATASLQAKLFGPSAGPTMSDLYAEMSYGNVTLTGDVYGWVGLPNVDTYYEAGCNGLCGSAKTGELIETTLQSADVSVDFGLYDNDGPDGLPNSGDDDGFVDFVAFVHPETGGECGGSNLWSHRWVVGGWPEFGSGFNPNVNSFVTNDARQGGGFIRVWDYTIQPALGSTSGCGSGINEIGVFCHEFGHAFGLPDLYDTDGGGSGIGHHGLMGSGSWNSPSNPAHMCAWSKIELGWLTPIEMGPFAQNVTLANVEQNPEVYSLPFYDDMWSRKQTAAIAGSWSLHCGLNNNQASARNWPGATGYGNGWQERIQRDFSYNGTGSVTLSFQHSYDTENSYDFGRIIVCVGGAETVLRTYTGTGAGSESIDLTPYLGGAPTSYRLIAEFTSDGSWSDEDGNYDSGTNGPFKIDNVSVTGGGENYSSGFEQYEDGWYVDFTDAPPREFFLVEYRSREGVFDQAVHAEGLMVWHIEQRIAHSSLGNTGGTASTTNLVPAGVMLEEADGNNHLLLGANRGDAGDIFPGSTLNTLFTTATTPSAKNHNNQGRRARIRNIAGAGGPAMSAELRGGRRPPSLASITPNQGVAGDLVPIAEVLGNLFVKDAIFLLRSTGAAGTAGASSSAGDHPAASVEWIGKAKLTGEIDLSSVPAGSYNVVVRNPDGQETADTVPFTVLAPVPVFIQAFAAEALEEGIVLSWDLFADEELSGFRIRRRVENQGAYEDIQGPYLIDADTREFRDDTTQPGTRYEYVLVVVLPDQSELQSGIARAQTPAVELALFQNEPNPFNPSTTISFTLPADSDVGLRVYDVTGALVKTLVDGRRNRGTNRVIWNGTNSNGTPVGSGVYFYRLTTKDRRLTKKMLLLK